MEADVSDIQETEGIGKVIAGSLFDYLHDIKHLMIIDKLRNAGVSMEEIEEEHAGGAFEGEMVVLTGKLTRMGRREASSSKAVMPRALSRTRPRLSLPERMPAVSWKKPEPKASLSSMKTNF
jgi:hypothetical protein